MKSSLLYNISRYVMAALFIFSGFAKAINPFGLSIQLGEYFSAMGLSFLRPLAPVGGVLLPAVEMFLGLMLLVGLSRRFTGWAVMLFMGFFTGLTLWIALYNPVTDCGCFGDLLKISNWQTFIKNVVLLPFAVVLACFSWRYRGSAPVSSSCSSCRCGGGVWWVWCLLAVVSLLLPVYTYFRLPIVDATPFKVGVNVPEAMQVAGGDAAVGGVYHTTLIYKEIATGKVREFEVEDTTWYDSSKWEYVDARTETLQEGAVADIKSLPMLDPVTGEDVAGQVLGRDGRTLLVVAVGFDKVTPNVVGQLAEYISAAPHSEQLGGGVDHVVVLTADRFEQGGVVPSAFGSLASGGVAFYGSDYTVLNTMVQSHLGGALLLDNGVIVGKWSMNNLPDSL